MNDLSTQAARSNNPPMPQSARRDDVILRFDGSIPLKLNKPCLGEFVLTSEALYFIAKAMGSRFSQAMGGGLIGGIARAAGEAKDRKARADAEAEMDGKSLEELLAANENSFKAPIADIEELRFSLMWGNRLKTKSRKVRLDVRPSRETKAEIKAWCERFGVPHKGL